MNNENLEHILDEANKIKESIVKKMMIEIYGSNFLEIVKGKFGQRLFDSYNKKTIYLLDGVELFEIYYPKIENGITLVVDYKRIINEK